MLRLMYVSRLMWQRWLKKARLKNQLWRWCCCPDTLSLFRFKSGLETSLLMDFSGPVLMQHSFDKCGLKINFSVSNSSRRLGLCYLFISRHFGTHFFWLLKNRVARIICKSIQICYQFHKVWLWIKPWRTDVVSSFFVLGHFSIVFF